LAVVLRTYRPGVTFPYLDGDPQVIDLNHRARRLLVCLLSTALAASGWLAVSTSALAAAAPHLHAGRHRVSPHVIGRHKRRAGSNQHSLNWSGYIKAGSAITSSTAAWHVPALKTTDDGYSSTWVGIDGASSADAYLIQTGTEADVVNGRATYSAWWEVITPSDEAPETRFTSLTIHPGDSMSASVRKSASGKWTMRLSDNTTGHSASHTSAFAGPGSSAEWIQEDTDVDGAISTAPNWQSVTFSRITVNGANPALTASEAVDIVDSQGTREDVTSAPTPSGSGFTVSWLATGTQTSAG
jgi:hypothetical protein